MKAFKRSGFKSKLCLVAAGAVLACAVEAKAVPLLQLYIEGATYDSATETWVGDFAAGDTLTVWAIGNIDGEGGKGTIYDVKLAIAYDSTESPTISVASTTTEGYGGFSDPSTANAATWSQTVTDGSAPLLGDGSSLPDHGIYGAGTSWTEYSLGDFWRTDAYGGDFINSLPAPPTAGYDINAYEITISNAGYVHFDLYDHTVSATSGQVKYTFAPFSHDGEGGDVPDGGGTLALLGLGLVGLGVFVRRLQLKTT